MAAVLITGASGLVGRKVLAAWPGAAPMALTRAEHDLLAPGAFAGLVRDRRPEAVVHLAWTASGTPSYRTHPDNERWRQASLEAARTCLELGVRFVGVGTVVDDQPADDAYSSAKHGLRQDLAGAITAGAITWLRPFYVFDPDQPSPAVLREAVAARDAGEQVLLGRPHAAHDFVHVADVGTAVVTAVVHGLAGVVDVGSGRTHSVAELVAACGAAWQSSAAPSGAVTHSDAAADIGPLRAAGWFPEETERYFHHD